MNKKTALLMALLALGMMAGPSMAAEMTGGENSSVPVAGVLGKQLSPNVFGTGYFTDGVSDEMIRGAIDKHYGVAPAWEGRTEESLTRVEKAENELWKHLGPNAFGVGYIADGASDLEFRGTIDKHYGVAPAWENKPEEPRTNIEKAERELWRHLAPNIKYNNNVF